MEESPTPLDQKRLIRKSNTDRILSLAAIFVSICTLTILFYQTHLSQKMYYLEEKAQKMSVFPYLEVGQSQNEGQYFKILLMNTGVGPAKVKDVRVRYQDSVYHLELSHFLIKIADPTLSFYNTSVHKGRLVAANETIEIVGNDSPGDPNIQKLKQVFSSPGFNLEIDYTSIYEDQVWTAYFNTPSEHDK